MVDVANALDNLRVHQRQLDADGVMVGVSRQALDEVIRHCGKVDAHIEALEAQLAEAKAVLHIATNDKLSLLEQLDTERQGRMAQIDYSCDLQRIIEDLCRGGPVREPKTSARHHYDMATAFLSALEATPAPMVTEADWRKIYDKLAEQGGGTWATYMMMEIAAAYGDYELAPEAALTAAQEAGR